MTDFSTHTSMTRDEAVVMLLDELSQIPYVLAKLMKGISNEFDGDGYHYFMDGLDNLSSEDKQGIKDFFNLIKEDLSK